MSKLWERITGRAEQQLRDRHKQDIRMLKTQHAKEIEQMRLAAIEHKVMLYRKIGWIDTPTLDSSNRPSPATYTWSATIIDESVVSDAIRLITTTAINPPAQEENQ